MKYLKSIVLFILIIGALYLTMSCIIAIPLMDENNNKIKELNVQLSNEMKNIRTIFEAHLNQFYYDSLTLSRYDETTKVFRSSNSNNSSMRLKNYLNLRIKNYRQGIENTGDLFMYKFNLENNEYDFKLMNEKKNIIIQQYKKNCFEAEKDITNNYLAVIRSVNLLYSFSLTDTSKNHRLTKIEANKINNYLFFAPLEIDYGKKLDSLNYNKQSNILFSLNESLLKKNSSSLVVVLGMLGMSFFGAVISLIRKNPLTNFNAEIVIDRLLSILLVSVASSLITYLSLQGGVTLITVGNDTKLNPYLILCICFASSVFSEEIWVRVKGWVEKK